MTQSNLPQDRDGTASTVLAVPTPTDTGAQATKRRALLLPGALLAIVAALLAVGIVPRLHASTELSQQVAAQRETIVDAVRPKPAPASQELLLPGSVMPYADASIYARTSGYVRHWYADIG